MTQNALAGNATAVVEPRTEYAVHTSGFGGICLYCKHEHPLGDNHKPDVYLVKLGRGHAGSPTPEADLKRHPLMKDCVEGTLMYEILAASKGQRNIVFLTMKIDGLDTRVCRIEGYPIPHTFSCECARGTSGQRTLVVYLDGKKAGKSCCLAHGTETKSGFSSIVMPQLIVDAYTPKKL